MYILYLDDSGSIPNPKEDYFVLGGVCVPERSISWLTSQLDDFASTIDSGDTGSRVELHAAEIFGGKKAALEAVQAAKRNVLTLSRGH